ncbi:MAG: hypothetical protein ACYTEQ_28755 [Planctomycetota bacterium]
MGGKREGDEMGYRSEQMQLGGIEEARGAREARLGHQAMQWEVDWTEMTIMTLAMLGRPLAWFEKYVDILALVTRGWVRVFLAWLNG